MTEKSKPQPGAKDISKGGKGVVVNHEEQVVINHEEQVSGGRGSKDQKK